MDKIAAAVVVMAGFVVAMVVIGFIVSYPLMLLWNGCLVGAIDGVREVTWLQMWGIGILTSVLFKSTTTTK